MKKLTQAVFDLPECPEYANSLSVWGDGGLWASTEYAEDLYPENGVFCHDYGWSVKIDSGYDTTNWQQSAINREPE